MNISDYYTAVQATFDTHHALLLEELQQILLENKGDDYEKELAEKIPANIKRIVEQSEDIIIEEADTDSKDDSNTVTSHSVLEPEIADAILHGDVTASRTRHVQESDVTVDIISSKMAPIRFIVEAKYGQSSQLNTPRFTLKLTRYNNKVIGEWVSTGKQAQHAIADLVLTEVLNKANSTQYTNIYKFKTFIEEAVSNDIDTYMSDAHANFKNFPHDFSLEHLDALIPKLKPTLPDIVKRDEDIPALLKNTDANGKPPIVIPISLFKLTGEDNAVLNMSHIIRDAKHLTVNQRDILKQIAIANGIKLGGKITDLAKTGLALVTKQLQDVVTANKDTHLHGIWSQLDNIATSINARGGMIEQTDNTAGLTEALMQYYNKTKHAEYISIATHSNFTGHLYRTGNDNPLGLVNIPICDSQTLPCRLEFRLMGRSGYNPKTRKNNEFLASIKFAPGTALNSKYDLMQPGLLRQ